MVEVPIWLLIAMAAAILILSMVLWGILRERKAQVRIPNINSLEEALGSIAGMTQSTIVGGNSVEVLQNGDGFFPRLFQDFKAARQTINYESYVWWDGDICGEFAKVLSAKAREGLEVRLQLDALGGSKIKKEYIQMMKEAGVHLSFYRPFHLSEIGMLNTRTHRKMAVIDAKVAYLFGHGIAKEWTGDAQDHEHWRDTAVRLQGPVVNSVQSVFADNWVEQTEEVLIGPKYFPEQPEAGDIRVHVSGSSPKGGVSTLELMFKLTVATAQRELLIQNPYFIPDSAICRLLSSAVERGVDVRIMVPGPHTDSKLVRHAGHRYFGTLLEKGVRIFEYQKTLIHQKVIIVDGLWSHVGSTNLDDRSFDINDEVSMGIIDEGVADQLRSAFYQDLESCVEFKAEVWHRRPAWHRTMDWLCYQLKEQL
ncbi:MAG TPA: phospholipase D-like domain-containing protein [Thermoanaerobaculia bacterium]|nr:phospholipase D-like domain-containing protein [Thermoanaerobaculia bacterium]